MAAKEFDEAIPLNQLFPGDCFVEHKHPLIKSVPPRNDQKIKKGSVILNTCEGSNCVAICLDSSLAARL